MPDPLHHFNQPDHAEDTTPDDPPQWYCVRTQTKREYLAAQALKQLESVETYCPRLRYKKATRRGKVWWVEAMFPGYIFARFKKIEMSRAVIHSQGVIGLLKFGTDTPPIPESLITELQAHIRKQESEDDALLTLTPTIQAGDEVEIAHGVMQGFNGRVVEVLSASDRVKVLIEFMGQGQLVDTDLFSLLLPNKPLPQ